MVVANAISIQYVPKAVKFARTDDIFLVFIVLFAFNTFYFQLRFIFNPSFSFYSRPFAYPFQLIARFILIVTFFSLKNLYYNKDTINQAVSCHLLLSDHLQSSNY